MVKLWLKCFIPSQILTNSFLIYRKTMTKMFYSFINLWIFIMNGLFILLINYQKKIDIIWIYLQTYTIQSPIYISFLDKHTYKNIILYIVKLSLNYIYKFVQKHIIMFELGSFNIRTSTWAWIWLIC